MHILASWNYDVFVSDNANAITSRSPLAQEKENMESLCQELQRIELDNLVSVSKARLEGGEGVLYRAPSGKLVRSFLRVGNIQMSRSALDAVFFWLLPSLKDCVGIVTDTWSISSIAFNASRRLAVYRGKPSELCPVEMLAKYLDGSEARAAEAADIVQTVIEAQKQCTGRVVLLISATQSGSLVQNLRESLRLRDVPDERTQFVALFKLGSTLLPENLAALRDLTAVKGFESYTPLSSEEELPFEPIDIDEGVYFPLTYRDAQYEVKICDATKTVQTFLEEYGSRSSDSVVRVHRDIIEDGSTRHHGVWIDTLHLVRSEVFRIKFERYLTEIETVPTIIVNPGHEAGRKMAALATAFWARKGVDIACFEHPSLSSSSDERGVNTALFDTIAKANASQSILILDDAFITGRRLAAYQTHLRNRSFRGRVYYGVAIARPNSLSEWEQFARRLKYRGGRAGRILARNVVRAIETLVIPNWNEDDCPWCKEVRLHGDAFTVKQSRTQKARENRLRVLERNKELGLRECLY